MEPEIEVVKRTRAKPEKSEFFWLVDDSVERFWDQNFAPTPILGRENPRNPKL